MGSTRLSNKVLLKICNKTIIELIVERLRRIKDIDKIILATSLNPENKQLVAEAKRLKIAYWQGSEENVLDRFYQASLKFKPDTIVRVTGDCPLIDPDLHLSIFTSTSVIASFLISFLYASISLWISSKAPTSISPDAP